jgi:hypothetical protein
MNLGQITNTIEYRTTCFNYQVDLDLETHLNEQGKQGWFLHSIHRVETKDKDGYDLLYYDCIWQRITQSIGGLIQ